MLTDLEKTKIELEEKYRNEIASTLQSKPKIDYIETVTKILQGVAIIVGVIVAWREYVNHNEEQRKLEIIRNNESKQLEIDRFEQTAKEFRKYFYQKQFEFYAEAVDATAILSTEDMNSPEYSKARKIFYRLFWGKLSIVEEKSVERAMIKFENLLSKYENNQATKGELRQASLCLAHEESWYTINVWLDSTEIKNYTRRKCLTEE